MASHDVTKRLEKLDARPLEGHFAMRLPGRLARDIRSRWKTSHSKVIFYDFIAIGGLSVAGKKIVMFASLIPSEAQQAWRYIARIRTALRCTVCALRYDYIIVPIRPPMVN